MNAALLCLALTIFGEAAGEPQTGKFMVAAVVMNRVESERYPDTVCEVVKQPKQFSVFNGGKAKLPVNKIDQAAMDESIAIAEITMKSWGHIHNWEGALHYVNPKKTQALWPSEMAQIAQVGGHVVLEVGK